MRIYNIQETSGNLKKPPSDICEESCEDMWCELWMAIFISNFKCIFTTQWIGVPFKTIWIQEFFLFIIFISNCKIFANSKCIKLANFLQWITCNRFQLHFLCTNLQFFCTTIQLFWKLLFHLICNFFANGLISRFTFSKILYLFTLLFKVNSKIRLHILLYWSTKIL